MRSFDLIVAGGLIAVAVSACGDDGGGADAAPIDGPLIDAVAAVDAVPDAASLCPGQTVLTGEYVDWDSTAASFLGVFDAQVVEVGDPGNMARTAPNGRVVLCVDSGVKVDVTYTHPSYLPLRYAAAAEVIPLGGFSTRGLTPARAVTLATELGVVSLTDTQVLVQVHDFATDTPVSGITVGLADVTGFEKAFAMDGSGAWVESATSGAGGYVLFVNVIDDNAAATLTFSGGTCAGRGDSSDLALVADGITATTIACNL